MYNHNMRLFYLRYKRFLIPTQPHSNTGEISIARSALIWSVIAVAVAVAGYYLVPDLDVCPSVKEDFDDMEVAYLSSPVEGGAAKLSKKQKA